MIIKIITILAIICPTGFADIILVDKSHNMFSWGPSISLVDTQEDFQLPMLIGMDQPKHNATLKVARSIVAPQNLAKLEGLIQERMVKVDKVVMW